ncbi:hypothetical protein ACHAXM_004927 [Skeletonema potamos]
MVDDVLPHGSRELVMNSLVANNAWDKDMPAPDAATTDEASAAEASAATAADTNTTVSDARNGNLRA